MEVNKAAKEVAALSITEDDTNSASTAESNFDLVYQSLSSQTVDLVGDFAGQELFYVDGESLLRHCFENDLIDFTGKHGQLSSWDL